MPEAQLAFFRGGIEAAVKEAAVKNKEAWFGAAKPLPTDEAVRAAFNSRVREDEAGRYAPTLKVNVALGADAAKGAVRVLTARRLANGKVTKPAPGSPADVTRGCRIVPASGAQETASQAAQSSNQAHSASRSGMAAPANAQGRVV